MKAAFKSAIRSAFRSVGYDIRQIEMGQDAFQDIRQIMGDRQSPIAFDVGANLGQTIDRFRENFPLSAIHAFEPDQRTFKQLTQTHSSLRNVRLNNFGLGSAPSRQSFFENSELTLSSFLPLGQHGWGKVNVRENIEISTIDDYCSAHAIPAIDILKTDTQGFDLEVLKGANGLLCEKRVHFVYLEITFSKMYENLPSMDQIYRFLVDHGFELVSFYKFWYREQRAEWTDALFICPSFKPCH